jgi:hypothetical protein
MFNAPASHASKDTIDSVNQPAGDRVRANSRRHQAHRKPF